MSSEIELAWAAGFFDGEGSISVNLDKRSYKKSMSVDIAQNNKVPLIRFINAIQLDTKIIECNRPGGNGKIITALGIVRAKKFSTHYKISYWSQKGIKVMRLLYPYLSDIKREQYQKCYEELYRTRDENVVSHYSQLGTL